MLRATSFASSIYASWRILWRASVMVLVLAAPMGQAIESGSVSELETRIAAYIARGVGLMVPNERFEVAVNIPSLNTPSSVDAIVHLRVFADEPSEATRAELFNLARARAEEALNLSGLAATNIQLRTQYLGLTRAPVQGLGAETPATRIGGDTLQTNMPTQYAWLKAALADAHWQTWALVAMVFVALLYAFWAWRTWRPPSPDLRAYDAGEVSDTTLAGLKISASGAEPFAKAEAQAEIKTEAVAEKSLSSVEPTAEKDAAASSNDGEPAHETNGLFVNVPVHGVVAKVGNAGNAANPRMEPNLNTPRAHFEEILGYAITHADFFAHLERFWAFGQDTTRLDKLALLFAFLGKPNFSRAFAHLDTEEILRIEAHTPPKAQRVRLEEALFNDARTVEARLGEEGSASLLGFMHYVNNETILAILRDEPEDIRAMLLSSLPASRAQELLNLVPEGFCAPALLAHHQTKAGAVPADMAANLMDKTLTYLQRRNVSVSGMHFISHLLMDLDIEAENVVLANLRQTMPEVYYEMRTMHVSFDAVLQLTPTDFARVVEQVGEMQLAIALYDVEEETVGHLLSACSAQFVHMVHIQRRDIFAPERLSIENNRRLLCKRANALLRRQQIEAPAPADANDADIKAWLAPHQTLTSNGAKHAGAAIQQEQQDAPALPTNAPSVVRTARNDHERLEDDSNVINLSRRRKTV